MPPIRIVVMLLLAIPFALIGYFVTGNVLTGMGLATGIGGILVIFLPMLVAGICAIPFIAPFVDYKAKQALANSPSALAAAAKAAPSDEAGAPPRKDETSAD